MKFLNLIKNNKLGTIVALLCTLLLLFYFPTTRNYVLWYVLPKQPCHAHFVDIGDRNCVDKSLVFCSGDYFPKSCLPKHEQQSHY